MRRFIISLGAIFSLLVASVGFAPAVDAAWVYDYGYFQNGSCYFTGTVQGDDDYSGWMQGWTSGGSYCESHSVTIYFFQNGQLNSVGPNYSSSTAYAAQPQVDASHAYHCAYVFPGGWGCGYVFSSA